MYPELTVQSCSYSRMSSEALGVIERDRGRQYVRSFNRKMFILPANCLGYAGLGMVGSLNSASTYSWVSGYYGCYEDVYFHEFGHNIGMSHASTPTQEYGDRSDFMGWGNAVAQINAPHVIQLGWANASRVIQSPQSQNYTLSAMDLGESAASGAKQVIQMSAGRRNNYFISYRARVQHSTDLYQSFQQKVTVHRQNGYGNTYLLATLSVGGEYEIPDSSNYTIRYVSKQNNEAVIEVDTNGGVTPPSPPTTCSISQSLPPALTGSYTV